MCCMYVGECGCVYVCVHMFACVRVRVSACVCMFTMNMPIEIGCN